MKNTFILIFLTGLLISCNKKSENAHALAGEALGTTYTIQFFTGNKFNFEKSLDSIFESVNQSMSTYRTSSDISKINRGTRVEVDDNFVEVFKASKHIYEKSNGFFDPTVGSLVNAYGFGPGKALKEIDSLELDSLRNLVGFNKITLNENRTISKKNPFIYLDFNAIAKGYTIDIIAEFLNEKGASNYLIELGGELRAKGENLEKQSAWVVGIDDPMQPKGERRLKATMKLKNSAMATSGNYRKYREDSVTGKKFVHTINPLNGKAEKSNLLSASVLAETCMYADGYATTFMAMGLERSKELLKKLNGVDAYLMYSNEAGEIKAFVTPGFRKRLNK